MSVQTVHSQLCHVRSLRSYTPVGTAEKWTKRTCLKQHVEATCTFGTCGRASAWRATVSNGAADVRRGISRRNTLRTGVVPRAGPNGNDSNGRPTPKEDPLPTRTQDQLIIYGVGAALTLVIAAAVTLGRDDLADAIYGDGISSGISTWGFGDAAGAMLWAVALYFCSPLQLLLLFLGKIDTERPSDFVLRQLGVLTQQKVDDVAYVAPPVLRAGTVAFFVACGAVTAWAFEAGLGDPTWSVSSGLGACMAAGVYEVGRPRRLNPDELVTLEAQWQDFARFAEERLQRSGRCHESEVFTSFRAQHARYRSPDVLPDTALRDMVRNWHAGVDRSANGFYRNLSLRPRVDPFTGQTTGSAVPVGRPAAGSPMVDGNVEV